MNRFVLLLAVLAVAIAFAPQANVTPIAHAEGIEVRASTSQNTFPNGLRFSLSVQGGGDITTVRLRFRISPTNLSNQVTASCPPGPVANCNAMVSPPTNYLAPGAVVTYFWDISDSAGNNLQTQEQTTTYQDSRFPWKQLTDRNVNIYYYTNNEGLAQSVLKTSRDLIDKMSGIEATNVDFPVKVWLYSSQNDIQQALSGNKGRSSPVVVLGQLVADDTVLVSPDSNGNFLDILRHELTHLVTHTAARGFANLLPDWVDEGTSVFGQNRFTDDQQASLDQGIKTNRVLPITSLSSALGGVSDTILAYGQSGSIVKYLNATYGPEKYAQFLQGFRSDNLEGILKSVYGIDSLTLENDWRKSVGLAPIAASTGTGGTQRVIPTIVPFGSNSSQSGANATPQPSTGSGSAATSGDSSSTPVALFAVVAVVAVVLLAGGAVFVTKRKKSA